jgi:hypothetical protein
MLATLFRDEEKTIGVARVELTDGGVTKQRVANAIGWFVVDLEETLTTLRSQLVVGGPQTRPFGPASFAPAIKLIAGTPRQIARMNKRAAKAYEKRRNLGN